MSAKKCLVYITAFIPFGKTESFVLEEILSVRKYHDDILVIPRNPPQGIFHNKAKDLESSTLKAPLFNFAIIFYFLTSLFSFSIWKVMGKIIKHSKNFAMFVKNMAVLPKSVYLANRLKKGNVGHIHAHWASTTTTMAYIIHKLTGIPYSFTLHRWDIYENNMLQEKANSASFVRCISQKGKDDVLSIIGQEFKNKVHIIHMGVDLPDNSRINIGQEKTITIMTPANLLAVKGHRYMIEACRILKNNKLPFRFWIAGDGPLEKDLKQLVKVQGMDDVVSFLGRLPHDELVRLYHQRHVDLVVLPSINTDDKEHEGIPVALMEAMSFSIPVISTSTGSISELLSNGAGIMVEEKNGKALAEAIERLAKDAMFYERIAKEGRKKIGNDFSGEQSAVKLLKLFDLDAEMSGRR